MLWLQLFDIVDWVTGRPSRV